MGLFFLLSFKYLEVPELLLFPTEINSDMIGVFDALATYSMMSHCSGNVMSGTGSGGMLKTALGGASFEYAFESTDRMQLIAVSKSVSAPSYLGDAFPSVTKIVSCRATVFMDLLLFRRNLQMGFVSAEDKCDGCKVHMGYDRNLPRSHRIFRPATISLTERRILPSLARALAPSLRSLGQSSWRGKMCLSRRFKHLACLAPGTRLFLAT